MKRSALVKFAKASSSRKTKKIVNQSSTQLRSYQIRRSKSRRKYSQISIDNSPSQKTTTCDQKQHFSIFTYINTFKQMQIGTQIVGMITRKQKRNQQVSYMLHNYKIYFQISIKNQIWTPGQSFTKLGVTKFQDMSCQQDKYDKYGRFSISYLAFFCPDFQNNHLTRKLAKKLHLLMSETINPISNISSLRRLNIDYQRIRNRQQKTWADEHFMEGMEFLKAGNNHLAIDHFEVAKRFDHKNQKIYIGKGCALANMNNLSQGLKQIKQALSINPNNEQANQYFKIIRQKIKDKQTGSSSKEGLQLKKKRMSNQYEILTKK